jgi:hypothetical protein
MRLAARVVGVQACRLATGCVTFCVPIVVPFWCDVPAVAGSVGMRAPITVLPFLAEYLNISRHNRL